jgi:hypothetical protein
MKTVTKARRVPSPLKLGLSKAARDLLDRVRARSRRQAALPPVLSSLHLSWVRAAAARPAFTLDMERC